MGVVAFEERILPKIKKVTVGLAFLFGALHENYKDIGCRTSLYDFSEVEIICVLFNYKRTISPKLTSEMSNICSIIKKGPKASALFH